MKATLPRPAFLEALAAAATLTGGRTTRPILSCVRIAVSADALEVSASDGETALCVGFSGLAVKKPGQTVVPADRLLGIVRELDDVEITLEADDRTCTLRGEGSEFKIYVADPADFPPIPGFDEEPDLTIEGSELWRLIGLTLYAAAREQSRYAMNGVLWEKTAKRLYFVATDGRRLARAGGTLLASASGDFQAIVPSKALGVFEKVFTRPKDEAEWRVDVKLHPNQMILRSGGKVLSTILVEGHFPQYQGVIPRDNDRKARLPRDEFHAAIRRAALLTNEQSRAVRFSFKDDTLVMTSQSPEQGEAMVRLRMSYDGPPLEIGFNPGFLAEALRVMPYEEVTLELKEAARPGVLSGGDREEYFYVIMPVSL